MDRIRENVKFEKVYKVCHTALVMGLKMICMMVGDGSGMPPPSSSSSSSSSSACSSFMAEAFPLYPCFFSASDVVATWATLLDAVFSVLHTTRFDTDAGAPSKIRSHKNFNTNTLYALFIFILQEPFHQKSRACTCYFIGQMNLCQSKGFHWHGTAMGICFDNH